MFFHEKTCPDLFFHFIFSFFHFSRFSLFALGPVRLRWGGATPSASERCEENGEETKRKRKRKWKLNESGNDGILKKRGKTRGVCFVGKGLFERPSFTNQFAHCD